MINEHTYVCIFLPRSVHRFTNSLVLQQHIRLHTGEPTDLTPDQIRAAEVKEPFPPFHPFSPYGSPLPPQFLPHHNASLLGMHMRAAHHHMTGGHPMDDRSSMSPPQLPLPPHMMKEEDQGQDSDDDDESCSLGDPSEQEEYDRLRKESGIKSPSKSPIDHRHHLENLIRRANLQRPEDAQMLLDNAAEDLSNAASAAAKLKRAEEMTRAMVLTNGRVSPATSCGPGTVDNDNQSDVSSNADWNNKTSDNEPGVLPNGDSNRNSPRSSASTGNVTPPAFGGPLDLTPKGNCSSGAPSSGASSSGNASVPTTTTTPVFSPYSGIPSPHPHHHPSAALMHSPLITSSALSSLANTVLTSTAFSPVLMPPHSASGRRKF